MRNYTTDDMVNEVGIDRMEELINKYGDLGDKEIWSDWKKDNGVTTLGDKIKKSWYHPNWRAKAFDNLNNICTTIGCTYEGGIGENRRCTTPHLECGLIIDLLKPKRTTE